MGKAFFVAGTDTEIGKTTITAGLLRAANQLNLRTLAMKPLAAGSMESAEGPVNEDAVLLLENSTVKLPYAQVNPLLLDAPMAPHIAAEREGRRITVDRLSGFCRGMRMQQSDLLLIEGVGGWRVPLNNRETMADLAKSLQLPVILVVGMRLGCLNHALLSAEAIMRDGLPLAGWVANQVEPAMDGFDENIDCLERMIGAPRLATVPYLENMQLNLVADQLSDGINYLLNK